MAANGNQGESPGTSLSETFDRRKYLKAVGGVTTAGLIAGCSSDGGDETPSDASGGQQATETSTPSSDEWPDLSGQTVHFLIDESAEEIRNMYNQVASDFTAATGAQVNNEFAGIGSSTQQRLTQLIQAGDPPEVYFCSGSEAAQLANQNAIAPMNNPLSSWHEQWGETPENLRIQSDGDDYILPLSAKGGVLWYRSDTYGGAPETGEDLLQYASEAAGTNGMDAFTMLLAEDLCAMFNWMCILKSNGINLAQRVDGEVQVALDQGENGERMVELLQYMKELAPHSNAAGDLGCTAMSEDVASEISQASIHTVSRPKAGAISQDRSWAPDLHGVIPPAASGGPADGMTWGNVEGYVMFDTGNREATETWIEFMSQPQYLRALWEITPFQIQPVQPDLRQSDEWTSFVDSLPDAWSQEDKDIAMHQDYTLLANETSPPNPYAGALLNTLAPVKAAADVILNDRDPQAALTEQADALRNTLADAKQ